MSRRCVLTMLLVMFAIANMRSGIERACADFPPPGTVLPVHNSYNTWPDSAGESPSVGGPGHDLGHSPGQLERLPPTDMVPPPAWNSVYASQPPARMAAPLLNAPIREPAWLPAVSYEPDVVLWSYYEDLSEARIMDLPPIQQTSGPALLEPLPAPDASLPSAAMDDALEPEDTTPWDVSSEQIQAIEDLGLLDGAAVAEFETDSDSDYSAYFDELKRWKGRLEAGVNGSEGNSQNFQTRLGLKATRSTDEETFKFDGLYYRTENASQVTENKFIIDTKNDWLLPQKDWSYFVAFLTEYDEFRAFGVRMTLTTGVTRTLLNDEMRMLKVHMGGGTTRETGTPQTQFVPEAKLGYELSWKITKRQKLTSDTNTFIDVTDIGDIRVNTRAGWQILIDPEHNLNLELGILNRYDSTPNGKKFNDLDYSMLLFWEF